MYGILHEKHSHVKLLKIMYMSQHTVRGVKSKNGKGSGGFPDPTGRRQYRSRVTIGLRW